MTNSNLKYVFSKCGLLCWRCITIKIRKNLVSGGKRNLSCCLLNVTRNYKMFVIALKRTRKTSNEFYFVETNYRSPLISFQPFDLDSVFGSIKAGFVLCSKYLKLTYSATEKTFLIVVYSVEKKTVHHDYCSNKKTMQANMSK